MRARHHRRRTRGLHGGAGAPLRLTSLMDILTCLLLFMLTSFVAGGDAIAPPPGIELPRSTATAAPGASLVIAIERDAILLGAEPVASVDQAARGEAGVIEPLAARLREARARQEEIARLRGEAAAEPGVVTIQGDRATEFRVLQSVMRTVNASGYAHIALAVLQSAPGAGS